MRAQAIGRGVSEMAARRKRKTQAHCFESAKLAVGRADGTTRESAVEGANGEPGDPSGAVDRTCQWFPPGVV